MKLRIGIGNTFPGSGETQIEALLSLWEEVSSFFKQEFESGSFPFRVDARDLIELLEAGKEWTTDTAILKRRSLKHDRNGYWCHIDIHYKKKAYPANAPIFEISYFLQNLFLAMNLCRRGGCHLYHCCFPGDNSLNCHALSLNGHPLEFAWAAAAAWGWPTLREFPFEKVWKWLQRVGIDSADIARTPAQVAGFAMIDIAAQNSIEPKDLILVSQTLETLLVEEHDGISRKLKSRVTLVLAEPTTNKKWLSKFYDTRSKIVHGSFPIIRPIIGCYVNGQPQQLQDELAVHIDRGLAVIIAVLQDFIENSIDGYKFIEKVERDSRRA